MGFQFWFTVGGLFLIGPIALVQSFIYLRRGVYTKTFKGTRRREYVHKNTNPIDYWCNVLFELVAGVVMIGVGFWLLNSIPTFNEWCAGIRAIFSL